MNAEATLMPLAKGEPYVPDTWWEGISATLIGVGLVVAIGAAVVAVRRLFGFE
jgi:hypothetical protein